MGLCPCCVQATHIAVPSSSKLGANSVLNESGLRFWADEGPWAGRLLAAVQRVLDSNGSPLPPGWGWAARSLGFVPPSSLIRAVSRGAPIPIPTITQGAAMQESRDVKKDKNTRLPDLQTNAKHSSFGIEMVGGDAP